MIELTFPVLGEKLPADHGYALYGALSRVLPALHNGEVPILIGPIVGSYIGNNQLAIDPKRSRLRIRLAAESIPQVLPIAGKLLELDGCRIRVGVPVVRALIPAASLIARMVTFKHSDEPERFLATTRQKLADLKISGEPGIPLITTGPHAGKPHRRILRLKDKRIVGYSLLVEALSAEDSIRIQDAGLGGRTKMGCGFFVSMRESQP